MGKKPNHNGHTVITGWNTLTFAQKAAAVGISKRRLNTYRAMGAPVDDGLEAVAVWRGNHIRPAFGGQKSGDAAAGNWAAGIVKAEALLIEVIEAARRAAEQLDREAAEQRHAE